MTIKSVPVLLREVSVQAPDKLLQRFLHRGIGRIYHEFVGQLGGVKKFALLLKLKLEKLFVFSRFFSNAAM